jgi:hypothetical protein
MQQLTLQPATKQAQQQALLDHFAAKTEEHVLRFSHCLRGLPDEGVRAWLRSWPQLTTALRLLGFSPDQYQTAECLGLPLYGQCTPPLEEWLNRGAYAMDALETFLLLTPDTPHRKECETWQQRLQAATKWCTDHIPSLIQQSQALSKDKATDLWALEPAFAEWLRAH